MLISHNHHLKVTHFHTAELFVQTKLPKLLFIYNIEAFNVYRTYLRAQTDHLIYSLTCYWHWGHIDGRKSTNRCCFPGVLS